MFDDYEPEINGIDRPSPVILLFVGSILGSTTTALVALLLCYFS